MKRLIPIFHVLFFSIVLNAGIFTRSSAKKEYEEIVSYISKLSNPIVFEQWRPVMKKVDIYAQRYGSHGARDLWTDELEFYTGIYFNKGQFDEGQRVGLNHQIRSLDNAIHELKEKITAPREKRYAIELYRALFEKLKNAFPQKSLKGSTQVALKDFFGKGTFYDFAYHIIRKSELWNSLRGKFKAAAGEDGKPYEALLTDIERSLANYNALYLELKPADRSHDDTIRAKDILRRLAANIELVLENNASDPAFKIYGTLFARIHSALIAQIALEHTDKKGS